MMTKVRNRLVNFRVTEEEIALMKTAAAAQGMRCLSDFARASSLHVTRSSSTRLPPSDLPADQHVSLPSDDRLRVYEQRITALESQVSCLTTTITGTLVDNLRCLVEAVEK
jgi:hypothetical protein